MSKPKRKLTALERLDAELLREIEEHGPMLLWVGEDFPRGRCQFRGLELRKNGLTKWLGVKEATDER